MNDYDIIVIGGGAAGLTVSSGAAQLGAKTLLVSNERLGGDCLYFGCVPSKTLIKSAKVAHLMRNAEKFGISPTEPKIDFAKIKQRLDSVITEAAEHDDPERFRKLGADVLFGTAEFVDSHTIEIATNEKMSDIQQAKFLQKGTLRFTAKKIVIATGSSPFVPNIKGLREIQYLTNKTLFDLERLPESMAVLGAGAIGSEMAQAFARLGTKVTLIARSDRILKKESAAASASIEQIFIREGIDLRSKTDVLECKQKQNRCELKLRSSKQTETVIVEKILVATGRTPNTAKLKLENAGVEFDKRGIGTDAKLRTNQKHIYAIGDINGKFQFTHTAGYEGGIVVSNAILKIPRKVDYGNIPKTTFTDPEVATCGMSEAELQEQNVDYRVWHHSYKKQDRALAEGETDGFIKLFTSGKRAKVVGAEIIGAHAGELIHACILARNAQLTLATIAGSVFVYPTLSEIEKTAAGAFFSEKLFTNKTRKFLRLLFKYRG